MSKKILTLKTLIKNSSFPLEKKYLLISKNRYKYISPSRKGPDWIDYIYIYKGLFSLWRPVLKIEWVYSKSKIRKMSEKQLDIVREEEHCFKNRLDSLTDDSLDLLESDIKSLLEKK